MVSGERSLPVDSATVRGAENSEVLPDAIRGGGGHGLSRRYRLAGEKVKEALPAVLVVTLF